MCSTKLYQSMFTRKPDRRVYELDGEDRESKKLY